jgi:hypothetical protein
MEFYAAMKKNEMLSFADKWMELENNVFLNEKKYLEQFTCRSLLTKCLETENLLTYR